MTVDRVKKKEITLKEAGKLYGIPRAHYVIGNRSRAYAGAPKSLNDEQKL